MKLPTFVMLLACATTIAAAESPPNGATTTFPRYASKPMIEDYYPAASRSQKEQGTTGLRLCYDVQGRPTAVTVKESSGFARLDEAAQRWGKTVRITPGFFGGRPRVGCVSIPVKFSLEESQEPKDQGEPMLMAPPPIINNVPLPPPPPPVRLIPLAAAS